MLHLSKKMRFLPYLLIGPTFLLIVVFKLYPIWVTFIDSFVIDSEITFKAYRDLFTDSSFWNSLWVTLKMNLIMIPLQVAISLAMALLVNANVKGIGVFRTIYYFPVTISITIGCIVWNLMMNPDNGIFNSLLNFVGIESQMFFKDSKQALWCIIILCTWKGCGYWMMFLMAGLKNIDPTIYESAKMDGSGFFSTLFRITIPLIKKVLLFVFIANTTSNVLLFAPMKIITNGGPRESTNVLMIEAYNSAFKYGNRPRSSAIVMVLLIIIILFCLVQAALLNEKEDTGKRRKRA